MFWNISEKILAKWLQERSRDSMALVKLLMSSIFIALNSFSNGSLIKLSGRCSFNFKYSQSILAKCSRMVQAYGCCASFAMRNLSILLYSQRWSRNSIISSLFLMFLIQSSSRLSMASLMRVQCFSGDWLCVTRRAVDLKIFSLRAGSERSKMLRKSPRDFQRICPLPSVRSDSAITKINLIYSTDSSMAFRLQDTASVPTQSRFSPNHCMSIKLVVLLSLGTMLGTSVQDLQPDLTSAVSERMTSGLQTTLNPQFGFARLALAALFRLGPAPSCSFLGSSQGATLTSSLTASSGCLRIQLQQVDLPTLLRPTRTVALELTLETFLSISLATAKSASL